MNRWTCLSEVGWSQPVTPLTFNGVHLDADGRDNVAQEAEADMELPDGGCCSHAAVAHARALPASREMM